MKKQLFYIAMCSSLVFSASCSDDIDIIHEQNEPTYVSASAGGYTETRLGFDDTDASILKLSWRNEIDSNPETFYGRKSTGGNGLKFIQTERTTEKSSIFLSQEFTSAWNNTTLSDGTYNLLYPAAAAFENVFGVNNISTAEITLPLSGQTGKLEELEKFFYMTSNATYTGGEMDIIFDTRISIIRLPKGLQFEGISGDATTTKIEVSGEGIYSSAKLTLGATPDITFEGSETSIIIDNSFDIKDGKLVDNIYIAILPNTASNGKTITISATIGSKVYEFARTSPGFTKGEMYTLGGEMVESTTTIAQQPLNVTFNGTDNANWAAYGASYIISDGHLDCAMALQTNGKYRGDLKFNNGNNADINFTLNPSKDVYLAIKFIGTRPSGALKMEFYDGSQWFNSKWNGGNPSSIETVGGNYIYYFNLSADDKYIGETVNVRRMNFIIADAEQEPYSYTIDWIATFESVEAIQAYKDTADDGEGDLDEYVAPAVLNQTTNAGYASLNAAVTAAAANDVLVLNEDAVITSRINVAVPITIVACKDGASITRGYANGLVLLTQTGGGLTLGGSGGILTLDGASLTSTSNFIEASNGAITTINNNVVIKNCYSTSTSGPAICNKSNGQLVLNGVTFDNCKTLDANDGVVEDRGVVFVGTALTLVGDNRFNNCTGANIYLEGNTRITATDANHSTALNIMIQNPGTRTVKDVVLNYTDESKMNLMNTGYKFIVVGDNLQFTTN